MAETVIILLLFFLTFEPELLATAAAALPVVALDFLMAFLVTVTGPEVFFADGFDIKDLEALDDFDVFDLADFDLIEDNAFGVDFVFAMM